MKKNYLTMGLAVLTAGFIMISCEDDKTANEGGGGGDDGTEEVSRYVLTVTSKEANYIVATEDLTQGSITTVENGRETDTGTYWVYYGDQYQYRLVYNQGNAGVSSSYILNSNGKVDPRRNTYEVKRFTSYGIYGDHLITSSTGALSSDHEVSEGEGDDKVSGIPKGLLLNYIDVENESIGSNSEEIWVENYFDDGEFVTFAGILQVGDKIFTAPIPMGMSNYGVITYRDKIKYPELVKTESGGSNSSSYTKGELQWTQYPDQAYIAMYPNKDFKDSEKKLIKTDKISYACGRSASQYLQMIWAADNGDVYVFSPSYAKRMSDAKQQTTLDAGVMRIKSGEEEFDSTYYVNIEDQTDGLSFLRSWHISDDYFLLLMYDQVLDPAATATASSLAIFKGETGILTYVTGMPSSETVANLGTMPYFEDGVVYIPVTVTNEDPAVYMIDAATAKATRGITVPADRITSIGKMKYYE